MTTARFCAICTADIPAAHYRMGAYVVCAACHDDTPRAYDSERGYRGDDSKGSATRLVAAATKRLGVPERNRSPSPLPDPVRPGWEAVRVNRRLDGIPIDNNEAYAIARARFGAEVQHVATTARFHVFQRPAPVKADPPDAGLDAIEQYRRVEDDEALIAEVE